MESSLTTVESIEAALARGDIRNAALFIKHAITRHENLQGHHVSYAHVLMLTQDWNYISMLLPKNTNYFETSGWLMSLQMGEPVNAQREPIPWLTYAAIDYLSTIVQKEWRVFEYGSGNSTLWWSMNVTEVHSVEDDKVWYDKIHSKAPSNVHLYFASTCSEYTEMPSKTTVSEFDVILIDGSYRSQCCIDALKHINPTTGLIIFDNSDSMDWIDGLKILHVNGWKRIDFWGLIPAYLYKNCTSFFFKDPLILQPRKLPGECQSPTGITCWQAVYNNRSR